MKRLALLVLFAVSSHTATAQQAVPSFSASTDLVVLHVTVEDKGGGHVTGLEQEAFAITEGGRPQTIRVYTSDDAPVTVGLMLDNSGSMQPNRTRLVSAGVAFAESSNPLDEMFALTFDDTVRPVLPVDSPFTHDVHTLQDALTRGLDARGQTAMFDGLAAGLDYVATGQHERKVLIIVGDGGDNASQQTLDEVLPRVQAANVVIYTVALIDPLDHDSNPKLLKQLARMTGGEAFEPKRPNDIVETLRHIARDIRHTYTLGYESSNPRDGVFRKIAVNVRSKDGRRLNVKTRGGYQSDRTRKEP